MTPLDLEALENLICCAEGARHSEILIKKDFAQRLVKRIRDLESDNETMRLKHVALANGMTPLIEALEEIEFCPKCALVNGILVNKFTKACENLFKISQLKCKKEGGV